MSRKTRIDIEGLPQLKAALAEKKAEIREAAAQSIAEETKLAEEEAQRLAPVKTGELRRSIRGESMGTEGTIAATARHATFVEHGTYKDKAQPYMTPTAALTRRGWPARAAAVFKAVLGV